MLLGTYEHTIDSKNRLTLPSKVRNDFNEVVMISISVDNCIEIRTPEDYEAYYGQLSGLGALKKKARELQRMISAYTYEVKIDSSNRILLPEFLTQNAKITKSVVVLGVKNKLEVWDSKTHFKNRDEVVPELWNIMEEFDDL